MATCGNSSVVTTAPGTRAGRNTSDARTATTTPLGSNWRASKASSSNPPNTTPSDAFVPPWLSSTRSDTSPATNMLRRGENATPATGSTGHACADAWVGRFSVFPRSAKHSLVADLSVVGHCKRIRQDRPTWPSRRDQALARVSGEKSLPAAPALRSEPKTRRETGLSRGSLKAAPRRRRRIRSRRLILPTCREAAGSTIHYW
jgi:hypothetical protein